MKVKDLKRRLIGEKDYTDIIVVHHCCTSLLHSINQMSQKKSNS